MALSLSAWPGVFMIVCGIVLLCVLTMTVPMHTRVNSVERILRKERSRLQAEEQPAAESVDVPATRGVVMVAGGPKYGPLAWHNIQRLARFSPGLPVEVFALNAEETQDWSMQAAAQQPHVTVHNMNLTERGQHIGWKSKIRAIIECSFTHVLFLDADNQVLEDVRPLFDLPGFQEHGAVLWPDTVKIHELRQVRITQFPAWNARLWDSLLTKPNPLLLRRLGLKLRYEHEAGQMMFDKTRQRVLSALRLVQALCNHHRLTFALFHGDKDLFQVGFSSMNIPFHEVEYRPGFVGFLKSSGSFNTTGLIQRHPEDGRPLFLHVAGSAFDKKLNTDQLSHVMMPQGWDDKCILTPPNPYYSDTPVDVWTGEHPSNFIVPYKPPHVANVS